MKVLRYTSYCGTIAADNNNSVLFATSAMSSDNNASTPTMSTPSIVQQRVILIVFLLLIGIAVWWQNAGDRANYPAQKFSKTPVPKVAAELDFTSAEASWSSLRIDSQGNLKIDARTYSALVDTIDLMQDQTSEIQTARIGLLLKKQFGATTSQQIVELLPVLQKYQEIEQRWREENGSKSPPAYADLFQRQDELLGETLAEKMFSEQRRLAKLMLASHRIQSDAGLTEAQKDQALMDLQNSFQHDSFREKSFQEGAANE